MTEPRRIIIYPPEGCSDDWLRRAVEIASSAHEHTDRGVIGVRSGEHYYSVRVTHFYSVRVTEKSVIVRAAD